MEWPDGRRKLAQIGITVVSAVALSDKAQAFHQAEQLADQWLGTDALPSFAVQSLRKLLLDIWQLFVGFAHAGRRELSTDSAPLLRNRS